MPQQDCTRQVSNGNCECPPEKSPIFPICRDLVVTLAQSIINKESATNQVIIWQMNFQDMIKIQLCTMKHGNA